MKDKNRTKDMTNEALMRRAIELSADSVRNGGGPFGAVHSTSLAVTSIPLANLVLCAWVLSIGRISIRYTMLTTERMLLTSDLMMISSIKR